MSNVNMMRWRLLRERLLEISQQAQRQRFTALPANPLSERDVETIIRLAGATLTLLEWHTINGRGRCRARRCTRARWVPWRRRRICPVFATVHFWMEQPLGILRKAAKFS